MMGRKGTIRGGFRCGVRFQLVGDYAPSRLDLLDEPAALLDLF